MPSADALRAIFAGIGAGASSLGSSLQEKERAARALKQLAESKLDAQDVWGQPFEGYDPEDEAKPEGERRKVYLRQNRRTGDVERALAKLAGSSVPVRPVTKAPTERNIDPNSEEGIKAAGAKARAAAQAAAEFGVTEIADPTSETGMRYVKRTDAPGESPVPSGGSSTLGQAKMREGVVSNKQQIAMIDDVIAQGDLYPEATGLGRGSGLLPGLGEVAGQINQRTDPKGEDIRNILQNIESMEFLDRSGKAVTKQEMARQGFIPNVASTWEANRKKLLALKKWAENETRLREEQLNKMGRRPTLGGTPQSAGTSKGTATPEQLERAAREPEYKQFLIETGKLTPE